MREEVGMSAGDPARVPPAPVLTFADVTLDEAAAGAAVLTLTGTAAWLLLGRGLRPLRDITRTAAAIAGGDLARRVPPGRPRTETGQLAAALNTMLGQIQAAFEDRRRPAAAAVAGPAAASEWRSSPPSPPPTTAPPPSTAPPAPAPPSASSSPPAQGRNWPRSGPSTSSDRAGPFRPVTPRSPPPRVARS
ncbi:putative methyl-accepting chemotaxis sensory transducer [Frankia casuarinae]|uniref:histidine kinase n=1 Tax=Frankia casuarinae (strain DSM 45818 / CECT 9043 / HFP020203 / CcI3) TaxID=106370 RepID=Q2J4I5_FRACC|nr:HAMP domain-containing protein [Frankia sp. B2]ABD13807.1 putative methyl-accepting chemotaxis sensory transducer [Frankia casuarinae]